MRTTVHHVLPLPNITSYGYYELLENDQAKAKEGKGKTTILNIYKNPITICSRSEVRGFTPSKSLQVLGWGNLGTGLPVPAYFT